MTQYPLPNVSFDLAGQVALVTGARSGLGWRLAEVLAAAGATVVATGRPRERLQELASQITSRGGAAYPVRRDVADADSILDGIAEAEDAVGTVTIAVNNAGIPDAQRAQKMSIELIDRVIGTNLRGPDIGQIQHQCQLHRPGRFQLRNYGRNDRTYQRVRSPLSAPTHGGRTQLDSTLRLCSPASEFVTAATILVDDGQETR